MARSKNRRKKPGSKKKSDNKQKRTARPTDKAGSDSVENKVEYADDLPDDLGLGRYSERPGLLTNMRSMISGGGEAKDGFLTRRRSLTEWAMWFGGAAAIYMLIRHLVGE